MTIPKTEPIAFRLLIRDTTHFFIVIKFMNNNFGKGQQNWMITQPVLAKLKSRSYGSEIYANMRIFKEDADMARIAELMFL